MKNEETSNRKKIRTIIISQFALFRVDEHISTTYIVKQCHKYLSKTIDPGTIRRELRYLRAENKINYKPVGAWKKKIIQVLNLY